LSPISPLLVTTAAIVVTGFSMAGFSPVTNHRDVPVGSQAANRGSLACWRDTSKHVVDGLVLLENVEVRQLHHPIRSWEARP
jgi:hypothetical protein